MSNAVPILIAVSLVLPFRAFEPVAESRTIQGRALTSSVCLADIESSCEPEAEDFELYFGRSTESEPAARFHGCVAILRCIFVAAADIDPLTCLPPPTSRKAISTGSPGR